MSADTKKTQQAAAPSTNGPANKAPEGPDIRKEGPQVGATPVAGKQDVMPTGGLPDIKQMSREEILELLSKRRGELQEVQKVAKDKGIAVSKKTPEDKERLMDFFERVGYQTGMAKWATGRRTEILARIGPVVAALGGDWDQERQGEAVEAMVEGFRTARIQTSFKSSSMPDKKAAPDVPGDQVLVELLGDLELVLNLPEWFTELLANNQ